MIKVRQVKEWDKAWAFFGIAVMAAALVLLQAKKFHPIYSVAVLTGIACIAAYLFLHNRIGESIEAGKHGWSFRFSMLSAAILLLCGIAVYATRSEQYVKPTGYYVLMALSSGAAFISARSVSTRRQFGITIALACALGLTHIWTESLLFPGSLIGLDPWHHMKVVTRELAPGGVTEVPIGITTLGTSYSLMHLYLKKMLVATGLSYKTVALLFVGTPLVAGNTVLSGLIGKILFRDGRTGAAASLASATSMGSLFLGIWIIPNGVGITLSLAAAYLLLERKSRWLPVYLRAVLVAVALTLAYFTHILAAVWVIGTVICLLAPRITPALKELIRKEGTAVNKWGSMATVAAFILIPVSLPLWMTYTTAGNSVARTSEYYRFNSPAPSSGIIYTATEITFNIGPESSNTQTDGNRLKELVLDSSGLFLYTGIAIPGMLLAVKRKYSTAAWMWALLGACTLALGFFPPLIGKAILEDRWRYFSGVVLSVFLATTLISLAKNRVGTVLAAALLSVIVFLSTIGVPLNQTNRSLSPNLIVRYALTEKEMQGLAVAASLHPQIVGTDPLYWNAMVSDPRYSWTTATAISLESSLVSGDFTNTKADMLLIREALNKEPCGYGGGQIYWLNYDIVGRATEQGYRVAWSNEEIYCLEREAK